MAKLNREYGRRNASVSDHSDFRILYSVFTIRSRCKGARLAAAERGEAALVNGKPKASLCSRSRLRLAVKRTRLDRAHRNNHIGRAAGPIHERTV